MNGAALTAKEAELFELLIRHPEQIQPKAQLLARAWGNEAASSDNYVEVYMSYLRKKLEQLGSSATIKTIRNLGYKLTNESDSPETASSSADTTSNPTSEKNVS